MLRTKQDPVRAMILGILTLAASVLGCATDQRNGRIAQLLAQIPIDQQANDALRSALGTMESGDVLVTITNDRQYKTVDIALRYVIGSTVYCDLLTVNISGVHRAEDYRFECTGAVAVFHNLHKQVAAGHKFRAVDWEPDWGGFYALALGSAEGVTTSEGDGCSLAFRQAAYWASAQVAGEEILDGDLADAYLDKHVMASCASYIAHAIGCFDTICEVGAQDQRKNEDRKPDDARDVRPP